MGVCFVWNPLMNRNASSASVAKLMERCYCTRCTHCYDFRTVGDITFIYGAPSHLTDAHLQAIARHSILNRGSSFPEIGGVDGQVLRQKSFLNRPPHIVVRVSCVHTPIDIKALPVGFSGVGFKLSGILVRKWLFSSGPHFLFFLLNPKNCEIFVEHIQTTLLYNPFLLYLASVGRTSNRHIKHKKTKEVFKFGLPGLSTVVALLGPPFM